MRLICVFLGLAVVFVIPFLFWGDDFASRFTREGAVDWLRAHGDWAWLAALLLLVLDLFLPIPATAVMAALGYVYGPWAGGALGAIGSCLSGLLAYGLCRAFGRRAAERLVGREDLAKGRLLFDRIGGWMVAVSRWLPLFPEVISCMAGLTRMRAGTFLAAVVCGSVPLAFTFAVIGHAGSTHPTLAIALSAGIPPVLWFLTQRWIRQCVRERDE